MITQVFVALERTVEDDGSDSDTPRIAFTTEALAEAWVRGQNGSGWPMYWYIAIPLDNGAPAQEVTP